MSYAQHILRTVATLLVNSYFEAYYDPHTTLADVSEFSTQQSFICYENFI